MPFSKSGSFTGTKPPINITTIPPKITGSLGRAVHKDRGYIEKKEIITTASIISQYKYFLLVIDEHTKKLLSVFGPFDTEEKTKEFSKLHGIELE
jgi:hypothetical protein